MPAKSKAKSKNEEPNEEEVTIMTEEMLSEASIEDLPGVGPATAEKLREAGFEELLAIAVMSPSDLKPKHWLKFMGNLVVEKHR